MIIGWLSIFLDTPAASAPDGIAFWSALTGTRVGSPHGDRGEFLPLVPADGDAYLWVQLTDDGIPASHLDLHVPDPREAADEARRAGASELSDNGDLVVLRSPAGVPFCLVAHEGEHTRPAPLSWPDDTTSELDQLCLDIPADDFDAELDWWSALTGWPVTTKHDEFGRLAGKEGLPVQLLFQRLDDGAAHTHLDFASSDRPLEVARHVVLGAEPVSRRDGWDVLRDPIGREYCVTDRDPRSG